MVTPLDESLHGSCRLQQAIRPCADPRAVGQRVIGVKSLSVFQFIIEKKEDLPKKQNLPQVADCKKSIGDIKYFKNTTAVICNSRGWHVIWSMIL